MVKNVSNPVNARRIAGILAKDASKKGIELPEREISVFFSDNQVANVLLAIASLKNNGVIPDEFVISDECTTTLIEQDYLDDKQISTTINTSVEAPSDESGLITKIVPSETTLNPLEFKNQFESLKKKVIKLWSGGLTVETHDLDKFQMKFTRPMLRFNEDMRAKGIEISELQSYAVIFAADHLGLSDDSRENAYHLMFGRFETIKDNLKEKYGIDYAWPEVTGSMYIDIGKKYSIGPEIADFAIRLRTISGLDTYDDEVIQELFKQLLTGELTDDLISRKTIFRWADKDERIEKPIELLIPPMGYNVSEEKKNILIQTTMAHTILSKIDETEIHLEDLLVQVQNLGINERVNLFSQKLEHALTRKSVGLQFGTTLANSFENFKTNPSKSAPFIDIAVRYLEKVGNVEFLIQQTQHSVKSGLKNSIGLIKKYLQNLSDEDLTNNISNIIYHSLEATIPILETLSELTDLPYTPDLIDDYETFNTIIFSLEDKAQKEFFTLFFNNVYKYTQEFAKSLEPQSQEPTTKEGGLTELTHDFISTVRHNANKNPSVTDLIQNLIDDGIDENIAEIIVKITSYLSYQIAGKEGERGKTLHQDLINFYINKTKEISNFQLIGGKNIAEIEKTVLFDYIMKELTQAFVLVSLASKTKTEVYNAWTPLPTLKSKNILYLHEFLIPNIIYWQRLPKDFIEFLVQKKLLDKNSIKSLVKITGRLNLTDAYSLIILGSKPDINRFADAYNFLSEIFNVPDLLSASNSNYFNLKPRTGEAEIVKEISYLWDSLHKSEG